MNRRPELMATLASPGWCEVLEPALTSERERNSALLCIEPQMRPSAVSNDSYIRGYIAGLDFARKRGHSMVSAWLSSEDAGRGPEAEPPAMGSPYEEE